MWTLRCVARVDIDRCRQGKPFTEHRSSDAIDIVIAMVARLRSIVNQFVYTRLRPPILKLRMFLRLAAVT